MQSKVHDTLAEDDIEAKQEEEYNQYEAEMRLADGAEQQSEPSNPLKDDFKWLYIDYKGGMDDMPWLRL